MYTYLAPFLQWMKARTMARTMPTTRMPDPTEANTTVNVSLPELVSQASYTEMKENERKRIELRIEMKPSIIKIIIRVSG